ncbi:hypothetical protein SBDP1_1110023 [Syntrophobacter sp. SbD1]|nr:hypothetical protein SBDP1_1110023 [Syntrophobacter sp. SbD1]
MCASRALGLARAAHGRNLNHLSRPFFCVANIEFLEILSRFLRF